MREIRKLILQLHVLSLAGEFYVVSGEISKYPVLITVNAQRWHPTIKLCYSSSLSLTFSSMTVLNTHKPSATLSGTVSCSDATERWCEISPELAYTTLNISPGHSEMIICTIPSTSGSESSNINFVNQFNNYVTDLPNVVLYHPMIDDSRSPAVSNHRIGINWTSDKGIREQLKVIQCVAIFECNSRPFKTSVISINFLDNGEGMPSMASVLSGGCPCNIIPLGQISMPRLS